MSNVNTNLTLENREKLRKNFQEINNELNLLNKKPSLAVIGKIWANRPKITFLRQLGIRTQGNDDVDCNNNSFI